MSTKKECVSCKKTTTKKVTDIDVVIEPQVVVETTQSILNDEDRAFVQKIVDNQKVEKEDLKRLFTLYNVTYKKAVSVCLCPGVVKFMIEKLSKEL